MGKKEKESNLTNELIDVGEVVPKEKIKEFLVKEWFIIKSYSEGKISSRGLLYRSVRGFFGSAGELNVES